MLGKQLSKCSKKIAEWFIKEIRCASETAVTAANWYFKASVLTYPQTMIIEQQIRQAIFVFEERNPQEVLVVILCEAAVRKYCNILKPFKQFQFIDGIIKTSHLNNNFVFITENSQILQIQHQNQQTKRQKSLIQKLFPLKNTDGQSQKVKRWKQSSVSLNISNKCITEDENRSNDHYSGSYYSNPIKMAETRSQKIECRTQKNAEQLVTVCGTVMAWYEVGKGRMNHGIGYRVEERFSRATYEVVVWCDMSCIQLKKGRTYQFSNFRPHKKQNLQASYHSHAQHSNIIELH